MGMIATPLNKCQTYSMSETKAMSYSSKYKYNSNDQTLNWIYYDDLNCNTEYRSYEMDDVMMNIHNINLQTNGKGSNCDTVDIKIDGNYDSLIDECDDTEITTDYQSKSLVINECIQNQKEESSAMLLCDDKKIYLNYYKDCLNCNCDDYDEIIYEYYQDIDRCYHVECNSNNKQIINGRNINNNNKIITDSQFIKNLILQTPNTPFFANRMEKITAKQMKPSSSSFSLVLFGYDWLYVVIGSVMFIVFCGICRYINSFNKEYIQI